MPAPPSRPAVSIDAALAANTTLGELNQRLRASQSCFERIAPLLPSALHAQLRPGPIDGESWTLLVPNSAVSAKLRQMLPALQRCLQDAGEPPRTIRVRILNGR